MCFGRGVKILVLQHATFEGPGVIDDWAVARGHAVEVRHLYRDDALPEFSSFDFLVVMGGEMNVYQYRDWPWLPAEAAFIRSTLNAGKPVVGICLGAQLIADALGARVVQNPEVELGWLPVSWTPEARAAFSGLPQTSTVLHWHGDTFALPSGATRLAVSKACGEQGFVIPGKCLGLQFHMEVDPELVRGYVAGQGTWPSGRYVQEGKRIAEDAATYCEANRQALFAMLDAFVVS